MKKERKTKKQWVDPKIEEARIKKQPAYARCNTTPSVAWTIGCDCCGGTTMGEGS